ncbi:MAG: ECF-type sigma factor [Planctomycetota bacterium]
MSEIRRDDEVRALLERTRRGESGASDELYRFVEAELRRIASGMMREQKNGHTLQTTALVNEAWAKLFRKGRSPSCEDQNHFLGVASRVMRSIIIDHARKKGRKKRTCEGQRVPLDTLVEVYEEQAGVDLLILDELLHRLEAFDPVMARAVDLRYWGGLKSAEVAEALGVSLRTFERRWRMIKAWVYSELGIPSENAAVAEDDENLADCGRTTEPKVVEK